jgi:hypothetical protein
MSTSRVTLLIAKFRRTAGQSNCRWNLHRRSPRSRSELPITATELNAIAAPAMIGDGRMPNVG